ncbi:MAG TPA: hypothetical protein VK092_08070 [Deinococcales bacterium]|nr:hypothetical protein [Deinococcales bacterium]
MIPWEHLADAAIPGTADTLSLYRRDGEYSLRIGRLELMNSRRHGSEQALAELALERTSGQKPAVLVGGLGMGFTLRAALGLLPAGARVTVAELVPEVVDWNRTWLAPLADAPLEDPRVRVSTGDVADIFRAGRDVFDCILLDTDNGPEGTTSEDNAWLYSRAGLRAISGSLRRGGVLAVWSGFPSRSFTQRLARAGFQVRTETVRARAGKGSRHTIWLAGRPA